MKLVDKDAVVAEIERRVEAIRKAFNEPSILSVIDRTYGVDRTYANAQSDAFKSLLTFLDTLEVKEVDLEKELKNLIGNVGQCDRKLAKHFFELGLNVKKGE